MESGPSDRRRAVIGICAARERARWAFWDQEAGIVAATYLDGVRSAGGLPIALVPEELSDADASVLLDRVDGLLLVGGGDIDPATYGAKRSPRTERTVIVRDRFEIALVRGALARDLPVLGICRGIQLLNVATGGTLRQHVIDEGFREHRPAPGRLDEVTSHGIELEPGSLAAEAAGTLRDVVNSHHHQAVAELGEGARVTARSVPDGIVEALEWPANRYVLGVQWHPEAMELSATIAAFVTAAADTVPA